MAFTGFTDRVVQYPGRVVMNPVSGEANTYDMSRAEGTVTTEGTPFNAETFNAIMQQVLLASHPVGSYLWTSDQNYNPGTDLGGTWEKIDPGVTLVSAGTGYTVRTGTAKDGGSADAIVVEHAHSVAAVSIGSSGGHSHTVGMKYNQKQLATGTTESQPYANGSYNTNNICSIAAGTGTHTHTVPGHDTQAAGESATGKNMPPYKAAYCWHRTA